MPMLPELRHVCGGWNRVVGKPEIMSDDEPDELEASEYESSE
jgi:hypothetical protein